MAIEIRGAAVALLDDPLLLSARGADGAEPLLWRARLRDDDGRTWQASAGNAEALTTSWKPAKATTGPLAALQSLRPVSLEVRVEAPDGRSAARTLTRTLVGEGVRIRRWREPELLATLHLPAGAPCATVAIDATAEPAAAVATLAAPLLASRGVLALVVPPQRDGSSAPEALRLAGERLAMVPGATGSEPVVLRAVDPFGAAPPDGPDAGHVVLPPGVATRDEAADAAARAAVWDALLARLGARSRTRG
ncbi:MAG TPA: hypothetical protein VGO48_09575 [Conexibacter sp.]|jgi:hypothetical protein|nr:hypothetical protein [Conexibacter sp.]